MLETELFCLKKRGIPMSNQKIIFPSAAGRKLHATEEIAGFPVRPGLFLMNGATLVPGGVSFTIHSIGATSCELCLFHPPSSSPMPCCRFPTVSASATPGR